MEQYFLIYTVLWKDEEILFGLSGLTPRNYEFGNFASRSYVLACDWSVESFQGLLLVNDAKVAIAIEGKYYAMKQTWLR